jgi:pyruvate/2-oxoglutarate dehydrogenase complex dihydrolipoamide acyltransferase (E2) component
MSTPVVLPELGGAATVSLWFVAVGERVLAGDRLLEVLLPGATFDVAAPVSGRLRERGVRTNAVVSAGQVLAWLDEDEP